MGTVNALKATLTYNRILKGYNKTEIAESLNLHPNTYRRKENNPLTFTLEELIRLKEVLEVSTIEQIFKIDKEEQ